MTKHLTRVIAVVAALAAAAYSTALETPAVTNFIAHHAADAGYIALAAAVAHAVYQAWRDQTTSSSSASEPPSSGAPTMGAK